ncbi:glycerophosphodiester phosphodiesterase [Desulfuromonas thiophila]|uniref:Glycerophosphoryl diester phosphodiesterase n=1 Tax=Desulfuromonas thiophila TaxID=57664 RepID=A0A1G7CAZ8_9BACT|nr:glycerophosphodiester phosphodiesterase family protein [Desulfuromonas thiophila]SDE36544.1 glycerophosphoryl diester phosphodiesterase [Desulfuromonas thiophila]
MAGLLCIGHRGAMGHAPENTLASFALALQLGAQAVELDVRCVAGRLLVLHDDRLERTTNGSGTLYDQSLTRLRALDAGGGQPIPFLEEVCALLAGRAAINIELKDAASVAPLVALLPQLWRQGWRRGQLWASSFDRGVLQALHEALPQLPLGLLLEQPCRAADLHFARRLGACAIHPPLAGLRAVQVRAIQARGMRVYVYTVNASRDLRRLQRLGVDGVFSNYPERVGRRAQRSCHTGGRFWRKACTPS